MSYRPQFAYPPPPRGVGEDQFSYSFDATNTPGLIATIPANGITRNIPVTLQTDAVFMVRALFIAAANLGIQIRTTFGWILSDDFVPLNVSYQASGIAIAGGLFVPVEPELLCTPGGIFLFNFQNNTGGAIAPPKITMYGTKRYRAS